MSDSHLFEWLGLAGLVIPVLIWLVVALVMRRVFARVFGLAGFRIGGSLPGRLFPKARWIVRAGLSLFAGLMIATAVGAVFPPVVLPAASLICDGAVELHSQGYSYKPGQRGVSHVISCTQADGRSEAITLATIGVAWLGYSAALFALASLWHLLGSAALRKGDDDAQDFSLPGLGAPPAGPSFTGSPQGHTNPPGAFTTMRTTVSVDDAAKLQGLAGLSDVLRQTLGGKMAEMVGEALEQARNQPRDGRPIVIDGGTHILQGGGQDAASRLRALQALRDQGLVTGAEYEAKRADILSRL
ncbi:SHOCT domain-containing protein [Comamonas flocculans]|uniref:SHOCT domain-containing protein n=1 Tax=Comamonas flocculans TaxID=2597701 RepID=A0A5B8RTX9_9BURK|nr:SHOCT domain-containing protein [Comamonas flocculans]QEA12950.1 SHOCT domain-containing protein [Comamonas flocculans]